MALFRFGGIPRQESSTFQAIQTKLGEAEGRFGYYLCVVRVYSRFGYATHITYKRKLSTDLLPKFLSLFQTEGRAFNRLEKEETLPSVHVRRRRSRCSALNLNFIHAPPDLFSLPPFTSGPACLSADQGYMEYQLL